MFLLGRRQKAHLIIHNAAAAAGGIGAGWLSDLVLVPDVLPLSLLQALTVMGLTLLFRIRPVKGLLVGLVVAFCTGVIGRGLAHLVFLRFPEQQTLIDVTVAVALTEALGWVTYQILLAMRPSRSHHSLMMAALSASQHGPLRVILTSTPMLVAIVAAFAVLDVDYLMQVRLRAPGGTTPVVIEHPLVELHQGLLRLSGLPRGGQDRVQMTVRNDVLAAELEGQVLSPAMMRVTVLAYVPPGPARVFTVDSQWQADVQTVSDYWQQVRGRLPLLLVGLLGTLAMAWLGEHRSQRPREPDGPGQSRPVPVGRG